MAASGGREAQPPVLTTLFFTEMWERFSYYGMRALLVLYLVKSAGYARADALALYATYTGLVYITPIFGGYLCDRYLGYRKSILAGGVIMVLGHFAMAVPSLLHYALGLLVIGNGFFKPNVASFLGAFYREGDPRRDGGFTVYYMGINLGAFIAPLVVGTLGERVGWDWGFAAAGVGMIFGLIQFWAGRARFGPHGFPPARSQLVLRDFVDVALICVAAVALVAVVLAGWPVLSPWLAAIPLFVRVAVPLLALAWVLRDVHRSDGVVGMQRVMAIVLMCTFVIAFWTGFEQAGGTMNLFADTQVDRHLLGWEIPASYFQAINPLGILLFGPLISALWGRLDSGRFAVPTAVKMGLGMSVLGLGFVLLYIAQQRATIEGSVGPLWLVGVYVLHTLGELCLSPVGLSMVTRLAPVRVGALMMGVWYVANGLANYLAGILESLLAASGFPLYGFLILSSIGAGVLLIALSPLIGRWSHGRA